MKLVLNVSMLAAAALLVAGCQSSQDFLKQMEPKAIQTAVDRGRFEMNCPAATGTVLSSTILQPAVQAVRFSGPERAEYTIGISGCSERATYLVICPLDGSGGCWSAGARNVIR
jgi:nitrous oxide reductase accessory protein NosL